MLDTRNKCENLYKELDRRQIRNENLMKETQNLRQQLKETVVSLDLFDWFWLIWFFIDLIWFDELYVSLILIFIVWA